MDLLTPDWPAPARVRAVSTLRGGGVSLPPYASLNLGDHVGDDEAAVTQNRNLLQDAIGLRKSPAWLRQVHGVEVVDANFALDEPVADAAFTRTPNTPCVVMTADCLPVLLCDSEGQVVAAAHAGWRGLLDGVIEATAEKMVVAAEDILVWLGPAIGPEAFEVGEEVREAFIAHAAEAQAAFAPSANDRWLADLYILARQRLSAMGVRQVFGGEFCTYEDAERFFSYRRDGVTGRQATLIWLEKLNSSGCI